MSYEVHVKRVAPQVVVTKRKHAALRELGQLMQSTLAAIAGSVQPCGGARGVPFAIYHNEPFWAGDVDVEMGLPLAPNATVEESAGVHRRELPAGPVAYTVHVGPYAAIETAYRALYAWIRLRGHKPLGPPCEIYVVGPGEDTAPAEYRTEIDVPID